MTNQTPDGQFRYDRPGSPVFANREAALEALVSVIEQERDEARVEAQRLRDLVEAKPNEDPKAIRIEVSTSAQGLPILVVTADRAFEEERLAQTIAEFLNLLFSVANELRAQRQAPDQGATHEY
jgi:predicted Ser/Thr protein kinase